MTEGAVGGEGLALVIHNDPAGLEAEGCKGTGVGFSYDASHYGTCQERITNSLALQLSPHFNVSEAMRHGLMSRRTQLHHVGRHRRGQRLHQR